MKPQGQSTEQGQAMVLLVLGVVGLLGFAAMAIDGGRIYTDRRAMQNASDTSSLTGAERFANYMGENAIFWKTFSCADGWFNAATAYAYPAAINRAFENGYSIDVGVDDINGVEAECITETHVGFTDKYVDVTTYITAETPSSFAQFVFGGPLIQTVDTIARIRPQTSAAFGHAIVALNPAGCAGNQNGVQFNGSNQVYVNGGGVFSNGCMGFSGGNNFEVVVNDGTTTHVGGLQIDGSPTVSPAPDPGDEVLPDDSYAIPAPDCSEMSPQTFSGTTMDPGVYSGDVNITGGGSITMNPGLYCFQADFRVTAGSVTGIGVTLYMIAGDLEISGNSEVVLDAALAPNAVNNAIPNVVIYMAKDNAGTVSMLGTDDSSYGGTVYAPAGTIEIGGDSEASGNPEYSTQLIGWNVFVHGNAEINLDFDLPLSFQVPPILNLLK